MIDTHGKLLEALFSRADALIYRDDSSLTRDQRLGMGRSTAYRSTLSSPTRRVMRFSSMCSSSAWAYFRLVPNRSRTCANVTMPLPRRCDDHPLHHLPDTPPTQTPRHLHPHDLTLRLQVRQKFVIELRIAAARTGLPAATRGTPAPVRACCRHRAGFMLGQCDCSADRSAIPAAFQASTSSSNARAGSLSRLRSSSLGMPARSGDCL